MRISSITTIFLSFLLVGCSSLPGRKGPVEVPMEELLSAPARWEGRDVVLVGMYGGTGSSLPEKFVLLSRTAPVWEEGGELGIIVRFSPDSYRPYEVLRVVGRIRSVSPSQFAIEASDVRSWGDPLFSSESLSLLRAGLSEGEALTARESLLKALHGTLSYAARYAAHMKVGVLFESVGLYAKSMKHFEWADGFTTDPEKERASRVSLERVRLLEEKRRLIDGLEEN